MATVTEAKTKVRNDSGVRTERGPVAELIV